MVGPPRCTESGECASGLQNARPTAREEDTYRAYCSRGLQAVRRTTQSGAMRCSSNAAGTFATGGKCPVDEVREVIFVVTMPVNHEEIAWEICCEPGGQDTSPETPAGSTAPTRAAPPQTVATPRA